MKFRGKPSSQAHVLSSPRADLAGPEAAWDKPMSPSMLDWAGHKLLWWDEAAELQLPSCHDVKGGFLYCSCG